MKMPFGKHRGLDIEDLPDDYLDWCYRKLTLDPGPLKKALEAEWKARFLADEDGEDEEPPERDKWQPSGSVPTSLKARCTELVTLGYRAAALKYHPDRGGDHATMVQVNLAAEALRKVVGA